MTMLSTVGVCQQFTLADSLIEQPRNARRARWSLCLAAELIDCMASRYLCSECTGQITVRLQWSFNCTLVQGIEFGARHYTKMVWPTMRNCKLLDLFLRRCLSKYCWYGMDCTGTGIWYLSTADDNCLQWPPIDAAVASVAEDRFYHLTSVVSAVARLMIVLNYCNHFSGSLVKTSSLTPHPLTLFRLH